MAESGIEAGVIATLLAQSKITNLTSTRIYPGDQYPQGSAFPVIMVARQSTPSRRLHMGGKLSFIEANVQVRCFAKDTTSVDGYATAKNVADEVASQLNGLKGTSGGYDFRGTYSVGESDVTEFPLSGSDQRVYWVGSDWRILYKDP